jgi:hypothetical protein
MPRSPVCLSAKALLEELRALESQFQEAYQQASTSQDQKDIDQLQTRKEVFFTKERSIRELLKKESICSTESQKLSVFFEKEIIIPPMPKEFTLEQLERWEALGMEVHYLPAVNMTQDRKLKNWKIFPVDWFYQQIKSNQIPSVATLIPEGWFVIDGRQKPMCQGVQVYENDPFPESRFNIHPYIFETIEMKQKISKAFDIDIDRIQLPEAMVWNLVTNIHHPEWVKTDTWEWIKEARRMVGSRLACGYVESDGNAFMCWGADARDNTGFRPMGRFSAV